MATNLQNTLLIALACFSCLGAAQTTVEKPSIHLIVMGGDDCPPCRAWKLFELPKLQSTNAFRGIVFSYVHKWIRASIPPVEDLPSEVQPHKAQLDKASGGFWGSPQTALIVNGNVYDYYWGTRDAKTVTHMIQSIQTGAPYPFKACIKLAADHGCAIYRNSNQPI